MKTLVVLLVLASTWLSHAVEVVQLRCEHVENPAGIGTPAPRLSWKLESDRPGEFQTAYQIQAAPSRVALLQRNSNERQDTGRVDSDQSVLVPWFGPALESRAQVFWRVRVWDKDNRPSGWSEVATFETGLLNPETDWKAAWITSDTSRYDIMGTVLAKASWINSGAGANEPTAVRYRVVLPESARVRSAAIHATADGLVTIYVNGRATLQGSSSRSAPHYADVRTQLRPGTNVIAIGSAAVRAAVRRDRNETGRNAIAAAGYVELENGERIEFHTTGASVSERGKFSWLAATAPATNWFAPDFDDSNWSVASAIAPYSAAPSRYVDTTIGPAHYLRKEFDVPSRISKARLYATALGVYEVSINGERVNHDSLLDPGWTDYNTRVMVQTYDVTDLIRRGENAIGAVLSDGWYAGRVGWMGVAQYGSRPAFAAQLEITHSDGTTTMLVTDETWKHGPGEIVGSDMQWGEIIDARRRNSDWDQPAFDDSSWNPVVVESHNVKLVPQLGPPVRKVLELEPKTITRRGDKWIVDFGQNLVGFVRLTARGEMGKTITVRHGETLDSDGWLYVENLRPALSTDTFILRGRGREVFEPHFTFHGFRYAEVSGYPGNLAPRSIRAIAVSSDTPMNGSWECADPRLNRLYQNIVWSQRGNFLSVPTDCPQRDERMGWMGDALVFAPTAARNADVAGFFSKWLVDVMDAQGFNGEFPTVAPRANQNNSWPVWGDAGVIIPWAMYRAYGDTHFLANHYTNMVRWVEYSRRSSNNLIRNGGVGDHLAPRRTPIDVVATAYFANSANIVAKAAEVLEKDEDAAKYQALRRDIIAAFNERFVSTNGIVRGDTQTAYLLALQFELLPEHLRPVAAEQLAANVETNGHLTTGFIGVGMLCPTLTQIGRSDLAWDLMFNDEYPSWLFSVKNGATTIWERWDGWTPERGFQDSSMNSFNHYSFGAVGDWMFAGAAGIEIDEDRPGYKHFFLRPQFTRRLSWVKASQETPYGRISSHWRVKGDELTYDVTVPPNSSATLELPVSAEHVRIKSGSVESTASGRARVELTPGRHEFAIPIAAIR